MSGNLSVSKFLLTVIASLAVGHSGVVFAHEDGEDSMHADDVEVAQRPLSAEDKRVVKALESYAAAVQSGKIDEIEKFVLTNDAFTSLEGANQEQPTYLDVGWINYRKHLAQELPMLNDSVYTLSNIRPFVHGDLAYATMDYLMSFTIKSDQFPTGEARFTMKGMATMVLWKSNNEWKIQHRHTTPRKPDA